jgi:hypothetical protein
MDWHKPRKPRHLIVAKARMLDGTRQCDVVIGNVSRGGLMAKCPTPPTPGARVEIRQGDLHIVGRVVWAQSRRFGLQSETPIDVGALFPPRPVVRREISPAMVLLRRLISG